ncbi:MAG: hypothetical protein SNJ56_04235 [Termitinemataceae bacterium]
MGSILPMTGPDRAETKRELGLGNTEEGDLQALHTTIIKSGSKKALRSIREWATGDIGAPNCSIEEILSRSVRILQTIFYRFATR